MENLLKYDIIQIQNINLKNNLFNDIIKNDVKYIHLTDFETETNNSINIYNFFNNDKLKNELNKYIKNMIIIENHNLIIYEFCHISSLCYISDMFFSTRVYKNKTIVIYPKKLPPGYRENIDIII